MRFSVLLPTRNRLDLLRLAVETVRRQDDDRWEIIVSDNYSDEDVGGYVRSLGDARIRYFRTDAFVPVTENWNNALDRSTGDYVIMLGDDDGLLPGYFSTLRELLDRFCRPDLVYSGALLYAYPGVMPGFPDGFLQPYGYADFLRAAREPFWLARAQALRLVRQSMAFRIRFGFNMQFATVSRATIERLRRHGPFYQSPYPDYYAMNALFLECQRILACPRPLVAIGISPKSFGNYYFNDAEEAGVQFLRNLPSEEMATRLQGVILPGSNMNTSWLVSMETLLSNFGAEMPLRVAYRRYRLLQALQMLQSDCVRGAPLPFLLRRGAAALKGWEKAAYGAAGLVLATVTRPLSLARRRQVFALLVQWMGTYPRFHPHKLPGSHADMLEVFEAARRSAPTRDSASTNGTP